LVGVDGKYRDPRFRGRGSFFVVVVGKPAFDRRQLVIGIRSNADLETLGGFHHIVDVEDLALLEDDLLEAF
jgi:hypothetical protein